MAKDTNFQFGRRVSRDSPDMTRTNNNVSEKWAWSGSRDLVNFWSKMVKARAVYTALVKAPGYIEFAQALYKH